MVGSLSRVLAPLLLHALAREVDRALGTLLHTTLDLPGFVPIALGLIEPRAATARVAVFVGAGLGVVLVLTQVRARAGRLSFRAAFAGEVRDLAPLYLRPVLSVLALACLAIRPAFPYGFTLPVALTQDLGGAQDVATLAALAALRAPVWAGAVPRIPAPRAGEVFFIALLGYSLMVPPWAREWDGHPGNEPKYLRMALALGHRLSLDVDGVDGPMEALALEPLGVALPRAAASLARENGRMLGALLEGRAALGRDSIRASRVTRQTIRGKQGGVFHVLAPGPSLLLAPTLRLDRALNLGQGTPGRLRSTLLLWNALGAALIAAVFLLLSDATGRAGLAAALAGMFALLPPFLFYPFQFYPEMPAALVLAICLRLLVFSPRFGGGTAAALGLLLASLPWLHQKFLPVFAVLAVWSLLLAVERMVSLPALLALLVPPALSLYLTALYNFAITGSVRPDALFLAWGPAGVTTAHVGQGLLGLLLDRRYGILPYAPVYLLAAGGLLMGSRGAARLRLALPAVLVYYLTVASADDWHGAVSNLGRYFMPIAPWVVALAGVALAGAGAQPGVAALAITLAGFSVLNAAGLWADPHAANDAARLLARSSFADGALYVPDLFIRSFAEGAPGLLARIGVWLGLALLLGLWLRHAAGGRAGRSALRAVAGLGAALLACGFVLESWPTPYVLPRFENAVELRPGTTAFASGAASLERGVVFAGPGEIDLLVRSRTPVDRLVVLASGQGRLSIRGRPPLAVKADGVLGEVPLEPLGTFTGRRGTSESLCRQTISLAADVPLALRLRLPSREP